MSVSAPTIMAITSGLITVLDMIDRMNQRFESPEAREQYITDRNAVRDSLMDIAASLRSPQEGAGDDLDHGILVGNPGQEPGDDESEESPAGDDTPSESGGSRG